MTSDDQLMLDFQLGSREAFSEIFERYRDPVCGFFRRRLDDPARAEELTQECFLALLRNATRYEPRASFRSYLYGIATKMLWAERRTARRDRSLDVVAEAVASGPIAESIVWIRDALHRLGKTDRDILMLREYEQLSYTEIGAILQIPLNTVRSRLFRARIALKDQLVPAKDYERGQR